MGIIVIIKLLVIEQQMFDGNPIKNIIIIPKYFFWNKIHSMSWLGVSFCELS